MTELDMTADDAKTEDFTDEFSDEALDREEGRQSSCLESGHKLCLGCSSS